MITLITATPGSGKTLLAVEMLRDALREGRPCYSNIDGLQGELAGIEVPSADYKRQPEGSFIVYDEAHQYPEFRGTGRAGRSDHGVIMELTEHRHQGYDIVFISQRPQFLHHDLRGLVNRHIHLVRRAGVQSSTWYEWAEAVVDTNDKAALRRADLKRWKFPKDCYALYKSSEIHTHNKVIIPAKLKAVAALITVLVGSAVALFFSGDSVFTRDYEGLASGASSAQSRPSAAGAATPVDDPWDRPSHRTIAGCISSQRQCRCYYKDGSIVALDDIECRLKVREPLPFGLSNGSSSGRSG